MQRQISILLILLFFSPTAYSDSLGKRGQCWELLQTLGSLGKKTSAPVRGVWNFTFPKKFQVDVSQVKIEASDWKRILSKSDDVKKEIVSQFSGKASLEKYLGLVDAIQAIPGNGPSLGDAVSTLRDEQRISIIWKQARLPFARAPNWKIGKTFFFRRPRTLTFTLSNRSPETIEEVASNLMVILKAVREAETKNLKGRSPLMSLFWGNGNFSYPRLLVDQVHQSSIREYNFVKEWNERTGSAIALPVYRPEGEAIWKKVLKFLPRLVWRDPLTQVPVWNVPLVAPAVFLFPAYDPLGKYHLSDEGFKLWQKSPEALRAELAGALMNKGRLNYLATSSRRLIGATLVLASSLVFYDGTKYMMSRDRVLDQQLVSEMAETISDPEKVDRILEDYSKNENPRVVDFFDKQNAPIRKLIAKLQKQIAEPGDPKGNLQNTINELEAEIVRNEKIRDRLKQ